MCLRCLRKTVPECCRHRLLLKLGQLEAICSAESEAFSSAIVAPLLASAWCLGGSDSAFSSQNRTATGTRMLQMLLAHLRRECLVDCRSCRYRFWTRNTSWGKNAAHASWRLTNILTANRGSYFQVHFATAKHSSLCPVGFYGHRAFIINGKLKAHRTTTFVLSYCIHMLRGETQSVYCKCFFPKSVSLEPY